MKKLVWLSISSEINLFIVLCMVFLTFLISLVSPKSLFASTTVRFLYDGDGVRVAKIEEGKTTVYVGDMEKNLTSGEVTRYYSIAGKRVTVKDNSGTNYIVSEHLGSLRVLSDSSGNSTADVKYYPYGTVREKTGTIIASRQYTSQINDDSTGLYFYNARYYNSQNANFVQADKNGPALNKYAYVESNPVKLIDPSGNEDEDPDEQEKKCLGLMTCKHEQIYYDRFNDILFNRNVHYVYQLMYDLGFDKEKLDSIKLGTKDELKTAYMEMMRNVEQIDGLTVSHDPEVVNSMIQRGAGGMYDPFRKTIYLVTSLSESSSEWDYKNAIVTLSHELIHHYQFTDTFSNKVGVIDTTMRAREDREAGAYTLSTFVNNSSDLGDYDRQEVLKHYDFPVSFLFNYIFSPKAEYELQRVLSPNEY